MTNGTAAVSEATATEVLLRQLTEHNDQLINITGNVRGFLSRAVGTDPQPTGGSESPSPSGVFAALSEQLVSQADIIDKLRTEINALDKIA